ncbi:transposase, partial [Escherichia coli]|nr:transposase [Escherichia coli]
PLCLIRQILTRRFRLYAYVYLDCIVLKVRQDSRVINKSVFLALGINIEGQKELLGMWLAENEGAMNRPGFPGECFICELRLP